jgi:hypothetical protein
MLAFFQCNDAGVPGCVAVNLAAIDHVRFNDGVAEVYMIGNPGVAFTLKGEHAVDFKRVLEGA